MGFRFRRRLRIAPGIRLNLSKSGPGISFGGAGGSVSLGPSGPHVHAGLPGTGLHFRKKLSSSGGDGPSGKTGTKVDQAAPVELDLDDEGRVELRDARGARLPDRVMTRVRARHREEIRQWMSDQCDRWNQGIDEILNLHLHTPPPDRPPTFEERPFEEPRPEAPRPRSPGLLGRLWGPRRERIDGENWRREHRYREALAEWEDRRTDHREEEARRRERFEKGRLEDETIMEELLGRHLGELRWPRETQVCFEIRGGGEELLLDVDLPPADELPTHAARPARRQYRILVEERSDRRRRLEYARHVHGVLFRVAGESFRQLPGVRVAVVSGFTQVPDPATGATEDRYLLSARVPRERWEEIHFDGLERLDLFRAFERFELRCEMSATGIFEPVEPFGPGA